MLTKTAPGLAVVLAIGSGALASTKTCAVAPNQNVSNPMGASVGTDPDPGIRLCLIGGSDLGRY
ncbi:MAG: hypothetical protein J2P56_06855 [Verrucomicrobia bacterium]|nr:hypothetical protein [Verrucomicrobiota bacterium]